MSDYAESLLKFVQKAENEGPTSQFNLADLAYTLQVGRQALEERLGFIVHSWEELGEKLKGFLSNGGREMKDLYLGQVRRNRDTLAIIAADVDMAKTVEAWIDKRKYDKLLNMWVKGLVVDWNRLYSGIKPRRISAPMYPFARERYWVEPQNTNAAESAQIKPHIHPLLHENTSGLSGLSFNSTFTGDEFFLKDHLVRGERVLPDVAHLEMARVALNHASEEFSNRNGHNVELKNVVWTKPIVVQDPQEVHINLVSFDSGEIAYEIQSHNGDPKRPLVHSHGVATLVSSEKNLFLDLEDLRAKLNQNGINPQKCYEAFGAMGICQGPAYQGLEELHVGENEVLAKLKLPSSVRETKDQFTLHPSILDCALQASIALGLGTEVFSDDALSQSSSAFVLESIEIRTGCVESMWAWVRHSDGVAVANVQKLDIDLCNDVGNVCVMMRGFYLKNKESDWLHKTGTKWFSMKEEWASSPLETETKAWTERIEAKRGHDILVISGGSEEL